jgi:hypothetical protein
MTITIRITAEHQQWEISAEQLLGDTADHEHAVAYLLGSYARDLFQRPASETISLARTLMRQDRAVRAAEQAIYKAAKKPD